MAPRGAQERPRRPSRDSKRPPRVPRSDQDHPKTAQTDTRSGPRVARAPPSAPKSLPDVPRRAIKRPPRYDQCVKRSQTVVLEA